MNRKFKISKKTIFLVFCFLAYIRPEYIYRMPGINSIYSIYRIVVAVIIFSKYFFKKKKTNAMVISWCIFEIYIFVITIVNDGFVFYALTQVISIISIAMLFSLYENDMYRIYKSLFCILGILVGINFITMLIYPGGLYSTGVANETTQNWFLGFKNKHLIYELPLTGITLILGKIDGFDLKKKIVIAITLISVYMANSSTALICIAILCLISLAPVIHKHYKIFNGYTYFAFSVAMFLMIPLFRLQYLFAYIIVTVLNKKLDLTYRTDLWDKAFSAISQKPIFGWGEQTSEIKHLLYNSTSIISAHNQLLEYLYIGGIILFLLYIIINIMIANQLWSCRTNNIIQISSGMYMAMQIALIAEVYTEPLFFMIYLLIWHSKDLVERPDIMKKSSIIKEVRT